MGSKKEVLELHLWNPDTDSETITVEELLNRRGLCLVTVEEAEATRQVLRVMDNK